MDKRYQVFISSTYTDLIKERQEVLQALLEMDCLPAGMELFPSANEDPWAVIERVIDNSDYYVVIVGGRYGSLTADGLSYTEREFDYAVENGKYILGFVDARHADNVLDEGQNDPISKIKLDKFIKKVKTKTIKTYSSPQELGGIVSRGLHNAIKRSPQEGWVRGKHALTPEALAGRAQLGERIAQLELELLQTKSVVDSRFADFAAGEEEFEVAFKVLDALGNENEDIWVEFTWDEILTILGPEMIDEKSEELIRERLEDEGIARAPKEILKKYLNLFGGVRARIDRANWAQIINQLRRLDLIVKGEKKRSPSDQSVYWRLSEKGDARLSDFLGVRSNVTMTDPES